MVLLSDVRDWIKTLKTDAQNFYVGRLDAKIEKSIGIYQLKNAQPSRVCIGDNTIYEVKGVSILIHWNKNARETETAALKLYEKIRTARNFTIGGRKAFFIEMLQSEPVDVFTDDGGIYERVIEIKIYTERK